MRKFKGEIVVKGKVLTVKKVAPKTFTVEGFEGFFDITLRDDSPCGLIYYDVVKDEEEINFNSLSLGIIEHVLNTNDNISDEELNSKLKSNGC